MPDPRLLTPEELAAIRAGIGTLGRRPQGGRMTAYIKNRGKRVRVGVCDTTRWALWKELQSGRLKRHDRQSYDTQDAAQDALDKRAKRYGWKEWEEA